MVFVGKFCSLSCWFSSMVTFCDILQEESDGLSVTLGIAAATGVGLLAFSEVRFSSPTITFKILFMLYCCFVLTLVFSFHLNNSNYCFPISSDRNYTSASRLSCYHSGC